MASCQKDECINWILEMTGDEVEKTYNMLFPTSDRRTTSKFFPPSTLMAQTFSPLATSTPTSSASSSSSSSLVNAAVATAQSTRPNELNTKKSNQEVESKDASNNRSANACAYCFNNKELPKLYNSHVLHDAGGKVVCPVLAREVCKYCKATGRNAHTPRYCPRRNATQKKHKPKPAY